MSDSLDGLERWMQEVITHPAGVRAGETASGGATLEEAIAPSAALTSEERIGIYASMYYERLVEALREDFPALQALVGSQRFHSQMRAYVAARPSRHYSLNQLGARLAEFLGETEDEVEHRPFLVELASLERAVQEAFDAPTFDTLRAEAIQSIAPEAWANARVEVVPALRLFAFDYPVNTWYQGFREERTAPVPEPEASWVAVYRREFRVWRAALVAPQYALLHALSEGANLGEALESCAQLPDADPEQLATQVGPWFQEWTADGLFETVSVG